MERGASIKWLGLLWLGLSLSHPPAVHALETVSYTPGSPFTFNLMSGNPNQDFGTVNVQSDSPNGWTLKVRSQHQGALKHTSSLYTIQYSLTIDGTLVDLTGPDATAKTVTVPSCYEPGGCHYPLQGTIGAVEINGKPAGAYADTLTFTLINH